MTEDGSNRVQAKLNQNPRLKECPTWRSVIWESQIPYSHQATTKALIILRLWLVWSNCIQRSVNHKKNIDALHKRWSRKALFYSALTGLSDLRYRRNHRHYCTTEANQPIKPLSRINWRGQEQPLLLLLGSSQRLWGSIKPRQKTLIKASARCGLRATRQLQQLLCRYRRLNGQGHRPHSVHKLKAMHIWVLNELPQSFSRQTTSMLLISSKWVQGSPEIITTAIQKTSISRDISSVPIPTMIQNL